MATLKASEQGKKRIRQARNDRGWPVDDSRWLVKASEILEPHRNWEVESPPFASGVSEGTWKAFLYRQRGIDTEVFKAYCQVLGLSWEEIREVTNKSLVNQGNSDWYKICHEMLDAQKQNLRRQITQMGFELNIHVPLGLVDRKQQSRRSSDFSLPPEQGSGFFQLSEEEIIKTYEHDEFLEQVIQQGQSKKSQGKRIAIIGEPGAGKTTLLEAIAFSPKTPGFPIWISLGSLGEKSLEEYLCQKWLKDALKTSDVTQQQKELEELFKSGEVLLLLDGVDEMPAPSPIEALAKIREELTGWVADARVVLTCRVNVWDANHNALQGFDTYRTLEFSYGDGNKPDQVREFICQWFSKTDKPKLGERLREKLEEDRHQRIRDLVKTPMRLSLLCQSWYFSQGDLPETKAALYEQFTRAFYEWKEDKFFTTPTKRKELNASLGLLAREAIDKKKSRFGIRESFAIDVMGEDLFKLATEKLHWLVHIYNDAETGTPVYAFFHPTFQEYFAACAIDDWHFFLNHNNENPNPFLKHRNKDCVYRIFEPQWKEVILLWLGREHISPEQKEEFILALLTFEDECKGFYGYRAYFIGAVGIAEFRESKYTAELVDNLIKWSCCYLSDRESNDSKFVHAISLPATDSLQKTDFETVISKLLALLQTNLVETTRLSIARQLGLLDKGNLKAIQTVADMLTDPDVDETLKLLALGDLEEIAGQTSLAFNAILTLAKNSPNSFIRSEAFFKSLEIHPYLGVNEIVDSLKKSDGSNLYQRHLLASLCKLDQENKNIIKFLKKLLITCQGNNFYDMDFEWFLDKPFIGNNPDIIATLRYLLEHTDTEDDVPIQIAALHLAKLGISHPKVVDTLTNLIEDIWTDDYTLYQAAKGLWNLNKISSINYIQILFNLLNNFNDEYIIGDVAEALAEIYTDTLKIIKRLVNLVCEPPTKWTRENAIIGLKKILRQSLFVDVIAHFRDYLNEQIWEEDFEGYEAAYDILWHCAQKMTYPDFYQAWHGQYSTAHPLENQLTDIRSQIQPTDKTYPIAIDTQTLKLETNTSAIAQKLCTKIYRKAGYSDIPTVSNAAQLHQYIPRIQEQLQKPNRDMNLIRPIQLLYAGFTSIT
jgi:hypothetical protein